MNCENIKEYIYLYIDNELNEEEEKALMQHISSCTNCNNIFNEILSLDTQIKNLYSPKELPPKYEDKIRISITRNRIQYFFSKKSSLIGIAAAILVCCLVVPWNNDSFLNQITNRITSNKNTLSSDTSNPNNNEKGSNIQGFSNYEDARKYVPKEFYFKVPSNVPQQLKLKEIRYICLDTKHVKESASVVEEFESTDCQMFISFCYGLTSSKSNTVNAVLNLVKKDMKELLVQLPDYAVFISLHGNIDSVDNTELVNMAKSILNIQELNVKEGDYK